MYIFSILPLSLLFYFSVIFSPVISAPDIYLYFRRYSRLLGLYVECNKASRATYQSLEVPRGRVESYELYITRRTLSPLRE